VLIETLYCGVCHTDVHMIDNDWGFSRYPMVPGHEIVGRVVRTGPEVTKLVPGDTAAVGCLIDSCRTCRYCVAGMEQYCGSPTFSAFATRPTDMIYGGFSRHYVVEQRFALKVPSGLDPAAASPLLCAGITTYSPLRHWQVGPGARIGVVGLGGLGHLAVKFARAMGAYVVLLTTSAHKKADALEFGAQEVVLSNSKEQMHGLAGTLDLVIDTVSASHDLDAMLNLLRTDGTLCLLGVPNDPITLSALSLLSRRRRIAGSGMGGLPETQEMLDFCAANAVTANIERIPIQQVNEALERLKRNDVRYRFVIDMASLAA
jgi:uncharacterized zinc-type alcohol dehydrogenase-like protein